MTDWLVQANPKMYDLHAAVASSRDDYWRTPRYRKVIATGDRAWLQIEGQPTPASTTSPRSRACPMRPRATSTAAGIPTSATTGASTRPCFAPSQAPTPCLASLLHCAAFRGRSGRSLPRLSLDLRRLPRADSCRLASPPDHADLDVAQAIGRHNAKVRQELKAAINELSPDAFELLVVALLEALGYDVQHTGHSGDGGVDAVAVLSLDGLTSVVTRVQAKRWANAVSGKTVRELRGALRIDERGLVVTTAEFTDQARQEAEAEGKARIGLIGGERLARLCAENGIGVQERRVSLLEFDPEGFAVDSR